MKKTSFRFLLCRLTLLATFLILTLSTFAAPTNPNILWITCEDTSPDLGCYGVEVASTPNLDKLANKGTRFTRAFSTASVCAPARAAIITGKFASSIGAHHMRSKSIPPEGTRCFTEYLREAGYYCTNNVKTDYNFDPPLAAWNETSRKAHWRKRPSGSPFFAVFNLTVSHESKTHGNDRRFEREAGDSFSPPKRHNPASVSVPPYYPDTPAIRKTIARYHDMLTAMDTQAGRILDELREDGLAENTIVFFFSDHGRGMPRAKRTLNDAGTRVPLIVHIPGEKAGVVRDELVSLVDLAPTMLSLAGVTVPPGLHGRIFLGPKAAPPPENLFFIRDRVDEKLDMVRSVRDQRFRYVRNFLPQLPPASRSDFELKSPIMQELIRLDNDKKLTGPQTLFMQPNRPKEELYDTVSDPHEINNLAESNDHRARLAEMRKLLDDWMKQSGDLGVVPEEELQSKWFPDGKKPVTQTPVLTSSPSDTTTTIEIKCPTPGSTIVYAFDDEKPDHWKIYKRPIELSADTQSTTIIKARSSRAGYVDSDLAQLEVPGN